MKPPPPMPQLYGSTTPSTLAAAIAASNALPPPAITSIAACVASGSTLAAAPPLPLAVGCFSCAPAGAATAPRPQVALTGSQRTLASSRTSTPRASDAYPRAGTRASSHRSTLRITVASGWPRARTRVHRPRRPSGRGRGQRVVDSRGRARPQRLVDVALAGNRPGSWPASRRAGGVVPYTGVSVDTRCGLQRADPHLLALVGRADVGSRGPNTDGPLSSARASRRSRSSRRFRGRGLERPSSSKTSMFWLTLGLPTSPAMTVRCANRALVECRDAGIAVTGAPGYVARRHRHAVGSRGGNCLPTASTVYAGAVGAIHPAAAAADRGVGAGIGGAPAGAADLAGSARAVDGEERRRRALRSA